MGSGASGGSKDNEKSGHAHYNNCHEIKKYSQPAIGHIEQEERDVVLVQHFTKSAHQT